MAYKVCRDFTNQRPIDCNQMLVPLLTLAAGVSAAPYGLLDIVPQAVSDLAMLALPELNTHAILDKNPALFELHRDLVTIESISNNEEAVSDYLQRYLKNLGLGLQIYNGDTEDKRNIYAHTSNNGSSKVLLTSHIDTVPPYIEYSLEATSDGDVAIHGRGTCDAKGSVAAQVIAYKEMFESGEIGVDDVSLLFVIGEEVGGPGMVKINKELIAANINWDTVVFGEPTENKLAVGHKGIFLADIKVNGFAAHSGYPDIGVDADKILIDIMHDLEHYEWPSSKELNQTTVNIGLIQGGPAANVISPSAWCRVLMRTAVGIDEIEPVVESIISQYEPASLGIEYHIESSADPVHLDYDVDGFNTYIASYATDIPNLTQRGFKRFLYGPGSILVAHGDNEQVLASEMLRAVDDYKALIRAALN